MSGVEIYKGMYVRSRLIENLPFYSIAQLRFSTLKLISIKDGADI